MLRSLWSWGLWALLLALAGPLSAAHRWGLKEGTPDLVSAGQLAFGPDGVVFVGDSKGAAVFAIDTGDVGPAGEVHARSLDDLAAALGQLPGLTAPIAVNDLAVNPLSGQIYLSLASGPERKPAIARIDQSQKLALLNLSKIPFLKATLPNPPEDKVTGEGSRARNRRDETVTDLAYAGGKLLVAGVTAGAAPSTIREIAFPFADQATGTVVEIYHGAHGRMEDNATVRTMVAMNIDGVPSLLAGFTCTPLVRFPIAGLGKQEKSRGTTVAELGNRNMPLDLIAYRKGSEDYLLMSNNNRGVMKISTREIGREQGIAAPVPSEKLTEGQAFETISGLAGTVQLDRLDEGRAVVIRQQEGKLRLETVALP
ncbi:MAG: hypothetical protein ACK5HA_14505 [Planctomycetaceae bacterium]|jgi:hypothetical protein